jgi:hypothetical protein
MFTFEPILLQFQLQTLYSLGLDQNEAAKITGAHSNPPQLDIIPDDNFDSEELDANMRECN